MHRMFSCLLFLVPLAVVAQNDTRVSGPVSGFVFDSKMQALRPMVGVPGASYLGPALLAGLDAAAVSPDGSLALAVSEGRLMLVSGLRNSNLAGVAIEGAIGNVDRLVWSADGAAAAVYSSRTGRAQVLRDLNGAPKPGDIVDVSGTLISMAVSAQGELLAGTGDGIYLLASGASPRLVAAAAKPVALAIRGADVFVADQAADRILLVESYATMPASTIFAESIGEPVGVQISRDGKRLYAAAAKSKLVYAYDIAGRYASGQAELDVTPSELRSFGGGDMWLLNSNAGGEDPLCIATGAGNPAAWFVPAGREQ